MSLLLNGISDLIQWLLIIWLWIDVQNRKEPK